MPPAAAEAEVSVEQAEPVVDDQPEVAETQPAEVENELQELIDEIGTETDGGETPDGEKDSGAADPIEEFLASDDFWSTEIVLDTSDGSERIPMSELRDRGLRLADYTRKTQALASERKGFEDAVEFHKAFANDPVGFARILAVKAQLIDEGDQPVGELEVAQIRSPEQLEAEIEARVQERFESDPRYTDMQIASARANVNAAFDEIEQARGVTLSPTIRQHIIDESVRTETTDFDLVLDAVLYKQSQQKQRSGEKRREAPSRPSTPPSDAAVRQESRDLVDSVSGAMDRAVAELSARAV
jgi:hypothetical protein